MISNTYTFWKNFIFIKQNSDCTILVDTHCNGECFLKHNICNNTNTKSCATPLFNANIGKKKHKQQRSKMKHCSQWKCNINRPAFCWAVDNKMGQSNPVLRWPTKQLDKIYDRPRGKVINGHYSVLAVSNMVRRQASGGHCDLSFFYSHLVYICIHIENLNILQVYWNFHLHIKITQNIFFHNILLSKFYIYVTLKSSLCTVLLCYILQNIQNISENRNSLLKGTHKNINTNHNKNCNLKLCSTHNIKQFITMA